MKNKILTYGLPLSTIFISPVIVHGQSLTAAAFFNNEAVPTTCLGIDFTLAKLVNDDASNAKTIQSTQFNGINDLMIKEMLTTGRVEGKPGSGFGFRNYWASAIKNAIGHVKSKDYELWKSGAGSK